MINLIRISFIVCLFLVATHAQSQLLENGGFEIVQKTDLGDEVPGWKFQSTGGGLTNDAHSGKYAMQIWNWYFWAQGTLDYGMPIATQPGQLNGWYKYAYGDLISSADSAICKIQVFSGDATLADVRHAFGPTKVYTPFSIPIPCDKSALKVDRISISFLSSDHGKCAEGSKKSQCLFFTVDDLELVPVAER